MQFISPLARGVLVQRYKRFFADVMLDDGTPVTAHCPNPGAMLGLNRPGMPIWVSRSSSPTRKLAYTLELVEDGETLVGVNTMHPNTLVAEALAAGALPELAGYDSIRREVRYGESSRIDFLLEKRDGSRCWLEVKNCHLHRSAGLAEFPDCVAARSSKHLRELAAMTAAGDRAVVLFIVQREDCDRFAACRDLDPVFAHTLDMVSQAGVEVLVYQCRMTTEDIRIVRPVPWARVPLS